MQSGLNEIIFPPRPPDGEKLTDGSLVLTVVSMATVHSSDSKEFCRSRQENKGNAALSTIHLRADVQETALHHYTII